MSRFFVSGSWVECPRCALRFSPRKKRKKEQVLSGHWKMAWKGREVLMVGRFGFRGWLGTWRDVIGGPPHIVPPMSVIGSASMDIRAVLRQNGLWVEDLERGRWVRAGKQHVHARTDLGKARLAAAGWPGAV